MRTDSGKLTDGSFRRWQCMTRFDIPDRKDPSKTYLTRWRIIQTPWFGIFLHRINLPDRDPHLHDHPWPFLSLVLWGGYDERRPSKLPGLPWLSFTSCTRRGPFSLAWRRATDLHSIVRLYRKPTWTLLLVGRRSRTWGFQTGQGWVRHADYFANGGGS